jgi:hypothetical protein
MIGNHTHQLFILTLLLGFLFVSLISPSRPMTGQYLTQVMNVSFKILSNSSFICHPTIRCYTTSIVKELLDQPPPPQESYFSCTSNIKVMAEFHPSLTIMMKHTQLLMCSKKTNWNFMTTINLHTFLKQTVTLQTTFKLKKKRVNFHKQKNRIYNHNIIGKNLLF